MSVLAHGGGSGGVEIRNGRVIKVKTLKDVQDIPANCFVEFLTEGTNVVKVEFPFAIYEYSQIDISQVTNNTFIMVYTSASNNQSSAVLITVSGNKATFGTPLVFGNSYNAANRIDKFEGTNLFLCSNYCSVCLLSVNGTTISKVYSLDNIFSSGSCDTIKCLDQSLALVGWNFDNSRDTACTCEIKRNGNSLSKGSIINHGNGMFSNKGKRRYLKNGNEIVLFFSDGTGSNIIDGGKYVYGTTPPSDMYGVASYNGKVVINVAYSSSEYYDVIALNDGNILCVYNDKNNKRLCACIISNSLVAGTSLVMDFDIGANITLAKLQDGYLAIAYFSSSIKCYKIIIDGTVIKIPLVISIPNDNPNTYKSEKSLIINNDIMVSAGKSKFVEYILNIGTVKMSESLIDGISKSIITFNSGEMWTI